MAYETVVLADSPVEYWRLDEPAGSTTFVNKIDSSRNGVIAGAPLVGQDSPIEPNGKAVKLIGTTTDYIDLPVGSWKSSTQTQMSLECWFRLPKDRTLDHMFLCGDIGTDSGTFLMVRTNGAAYGYFGTTASIGQGNTSSAPFDDNGWHHIVSTFSGSGVNNRVLLYVDGVQTNTVAPFAVSTYISGSWRVGRSVTLGWRSKAYVDEVAIYLTELPAARVLAHYNEGKGLLSGRRRQLSVLIPDVYSSATAPRTRTINASATLTVRTLSRTRTFTANPPGDTVQNPIIVSTNVTRQVQTTGWNRSSDETALGATGSGTFWIRAVAASRTTVGVTNTSPSSFMMRAYSVANPALPVDTTNLSLTAQGTSISAMATGDLYIMVDVLSSAGAVPFTVTFSAVPAGSISFSVASELGVSSTEARVSVAPASLSTTVSATTNVTLFDVLLDGEIIMSDLTLAADGTRSGFINIPAVPAGGYLLNLYGHGADVFSNEIVLTVERTASAVGTLPDDAPPRIPGANVGRWVFWDPAAMVTYAFPMNPVTASSTNSPRNHSIESTTKPTSFVVYEGSLQAKSYTFGGVLLDEEMYQNLAAWSKLNRRVWLVDHNGIAWQVVPQHFDVRPRTNRLNPWIQDYEFTVLLLKGPSTAEVV